MEFGEPTQSNATRVREELCALLAQDRVRDLLRLTFDRPWRLADLKQHFGDRPKRTEDLVARCTRSGLIAGSPEAGYRLAAAEALQLTQAVTDGPLGSRMWPLVARSTTRTVMAALLGGARQRSELAAICPAPRLTEALSLLLAAGVVDQLDSAPRRYAASPNIRPHIGEVLSRIELLVYGLAGTVAEHARACVGQLAYETAELLASYEPTSVGPRRPPSQPGGTLNPSDEATANLLVVRSRTAAGIRDTPAVQLPPQPPLHATPGEYLDLVPTGTVYVHFAHVVPRLLTGLLPRPEDVDERPIRQSPTTADVTPSLASPSQRRGANRQQILRGGKLQPEWIDAFDFPSLAYTSGWQHRPADAYPAWAAAEFDPFNNVLTVNLDWPAATGPFETLASDVPIALLPSVGRYLTTRHALRLIERVLLHERYCAEWFESGQDLELSPDQLTVAAYWSDAEIRDARRVINQHVAATLARAAPPSPKHHRS